jgi:hypothetical protein
MYIAALFTIIQLWKQPRCPATDDLIPLYFYNGFYSTIKKN